MTASNQKFVQQAESLYQRGAAAARGGQKTMAATLLRQAVKLNPQHEQAWLWLSGVLEKPEDRAFCLRAVLGINPDNERARQGLAWIEQQGVPISSEQPHVVPASVLQPGHDTWWSTWRQAQTTWLWVYRALLLIPIVLLGATLGVRTIIELYPQPTFVQVADLPIPTPAPTASPAAPTATIAPPKSTERAAITTYFAAVQAERDVLKRATETYRTSADRGRTTIERVTATRQLREQVQRSHDKLGALPVPGEVAAAHQMYVDGLTLEKEALGQVLEFYGSYDSTLANRAALGLQESRTKIATAAASWEAFAKQQGFALAPAKAQ